MAKKAHYEWNHGPKKGTQKIGDLLSRCDVRLLKGRESEWVRLVKPPGWHEPSNLWLAASEGSTETIKCFFLVPLIGEQTNKQTNKQPNKQPTNQTSNQPTNQTNKQHTLTPSTNGRCPTNDQVFSSPKLSVLEVLLTQDLVSVVPNTRGVQRKQSWLKMNTRILFSGKHKCQLKKKTYKTMKASNFWLS